MNDIIERLHALKDRGVRIVILSKPGDGGRMYKARHINGDAIEPKYLAIFIYENSSESTITQRIYAVEAMLKQWDGYAAVTDIYKEIREEFGD